MQFDVDTVSEGVANLKVGEPLHPEDLERKIFIGGLSWVTTEEGLSQYFESLGMSVESVVIMRDKIANRSRGFGFVTLRNLEDVDKAVRLNHHLDGRKIEAKKSIPKWDMENTSKKIFVGGIPISLSNADFRKYFENYGTVIETQVMTDRETGRSRGFGFVTYDDEEVANQVLKTRHSILGKPVEVKRAEPKKVEASQPLQLVHPVGVPGMYFPATLPYAFPAGSVFSGSHYGYDSQPAYFIPAQGNIVYIPQYEIDFSESGFSSVPVRSTANTLVPIEYPGIRKVTAATAVSRQKQRAGSTLTTTSGPQTASMKRRTVSQPPMVMSRRPSDINQNWRNPGNATSKDALLSPNSFF